MLITGQAGFIGRNISAILEAHGRAVIGVDDLSVDPVVSPRLRLTQCAVTDLSPGDLSGVEIVVHLAARKHVAESFSYLSANLAKNVEADHHLLGVCREARVARVIVASSCEVYGDSDGSPLAEVSTTAPRSPYAVGKLGLEHLVNVYRDLCPTTEFSVVRLFNVFGPDEGRDAVVPRFVSRVKAGLPLEIEGAGEQRRDFTYITDVAKALSRIIDVDSAPKVVNVGSGQAISILEVAKEVCRILDRGEIIHGGARPNEVKAFVADPSTLRTAIGAWEPICFRMGLERAIRYFGQLDPMHLPRTGIGS